MSEIKNKYIEMASTRDDYNCINPENFLTPNLNEMIEEDLMLEIYEQYLEGDATDSLKNKNYEILNAAYYTESPFSTVPGYYSDKGAFILRAQNPRIQEMNDALNEFDGDTISFAVKDLEDGGTEFTFNQGDKAVKYKGFKDYFAKLNGGEYLSIRSLGIDTAEIPHYGITTILKNPQQFKDTLLENKFTFDNIFEITYKEFKERWLTNTNYSILYEKYHVNDNYEVVDRKDEDIIKLLQVNKDGNKKSFVEIIDIAVKDEWIEDGKRAEYEYLVTIGQEESSRHSIGDAYLAKNLLYNQLKDASDIILVLNANGISIDKVTTDSGRTFNSLYYTADMVKYLIDQWDISYLDLPKTNYGYQPYGTDTYGRSLGVVYVKNKQGVWINLNKYILANTKYTEANPQFNDSPELQAIYGGVSESFNLWSYNRNNIEWADSFDKIASKSYEERIELHKKLTGIDFTKTRNCSLLLGDTLFLIPPESIRNVSQVSYERLPNIRSKGTMAKQMGNMEQILEISLYFYEDQGINGIPYQYTSPNGKTLTYMMNGLRSLIAQFKIAPFLPIENGYINDVLGIEAVTLKNFSVQTVEGFPRLLKGVLTLQEFNYRVFMPDLPIEDESDDTSSLSILPPMFAKSFNWDLFRYYYQRSIIAGTELSNLEFASYDYNLLYYGNKNTIAPWLFCGEKSNKGEISFYIPKEDWLANALQLKKQREANYLTNDGSITLSENAKKFCTKLSNLKTKINLLRDYEAEESKEFRDAVNKFFEVYKKQYNIAASIPVGVNKGTLISDISETALSHVKISKGNNNYVEWNEVKQKYFNSIKNAIFNVLNDAEIIKGISVDEYIYKNSATSFIEITWKFKLKLNTSSISIEEWADIKEILGKEVDKTPDKMLENNCIDINYKMIFESGDKALEKVSLIPTQEISLASKKGEIPNGYPETFRPTPSDNETALSGLSAYLNKDGENTTNNTANNALNEEIDFYVKDYKNPANMPFEPYIEGVLCKSMGASIANNFAEVNIKAIEGQGPQYLGGQDTVIEVEMITDDITVVSALNTLPTLASAMAKQYRRILPAWPIKIKSDMTNLLGVSEVLIDSMNISTVEGFPGVYSITMRMTSVDRTQRQKEALRRLDVRPTGGNIDLTQNTNLSMQNFFAIDKSLSEAELYPDLDLPSLNELGELGFRFVKYSGKARSYPDPDFYITYAYPYTALLIKKMVKDVISQQVLSKEGKESLQSFKFKDVMGSEVTGKVEAYTGLSLSSNDNEQSQTYADIIKNLEESVNKKLEKSKLKEEYKNLVTDKLSLLAAVKKLVMADVADGWEIRPGWKAVLSESNTENAVKEYLLEKKENDYAKEIVRIRKEAVELIDAILAKPMTMREIDRLGNTEIARYRNICEDVVNSVFLSEDGKKLIKLLCPTNSPKKASSLTGKFDKKYFNEPKPLRYLAGFLFSAGCALSGQKEYASKTTAKDWYPQHYVLGNVIPNKSRDTDPKYANLDMPYCVIDRLEGGPALATTIESGITSGTAFGAWRITNYANADIVKEINATASSVSNLYEVNVSPYGENTKAGFLDPYYNKQELYSSTLKEYKENILLSKASNAEAFLRNVLVYLRKMILDGLLISEIDIISKDVFNIWTEVSSVKKALKELGYDEDETRKMMTSLEESMNKSLCARLIYPFIMAITNGDNRVYSAIKNRDYNALNGLTGYVEGSDFPSESRNIVIKFLSAMSGINMSLAKKENNEASTSTSQRLMNSLIKDVYIEAADDPRAYMLHSFYDMLINDKRGRLVRAFPTYYVVFIDEGREIGSWKLHDNFYNMSSIASINVVKSRKIAADTCTIVMNNMFNSYAQEPDVTTTQQYIDVYGMRDVFDSIFSPRSYFDKEKRLRLRQNLPDTVTLQPGIRIHVRMGYSADGSKLPIVFNGKVAEVSVENVAQIIAQGDGHELMNPLNTFGQMEITSLQEAQNYFTAFKDIRGKWARGGESPRDLLALLLTAKYGGWKKGMDHLSNGRWFNSNPFGIFNFGDEKFKTIFEQGEVVQNLYEVSDSSLLKSINDFSEDEIQKKSTPIINTSLEDKTFWDLLHLAAGTGLNYIGAIRDFGFRSTVFLGKPNHYYAYAYELVDNKIVERRKPFQQFHYYDSYTDIVYNSIKASESQMKTNAIGIWQATAPWWGREQSTVGPIYLDMNIYPEYQKSMTVDTQLLAEGNGKVDVNLFTHLSEKWKTTPYDNKVNKKTAHRVTANALRDSVKDMYLGDLCVLGDPSVKPYDRVYLHDTYEDLKGMFEVEAVIHNMSIETGFTTSVMPDVIARHGDDFESSVQSLTSPIISTLAFCVSANIIDKLWGASVYNKFVTVASKSESLWAGKTGKAIKNLSNITGLSDFLDKKPQAKAFLNTLNAFPSGSNLELHTIDNAIDVLSKLTLSTSSSWDDIGKALIEYSKLDINNYSSNILDAIKKDNKNRLNLDEKTINKIISDITDTKKELDKNLNLKSLKLKDFADDIFKLEKDLNLDPSSKTILRKWASGTIDETTVLQDLGKILKEEGVAKAIKNKDLKVNTIEGFIDGFKNMFKKVDGKDVTKFASLANKLKGDGILATLKTVAKGAIKLNMATLLIDLVLDTTFFIITKNVQSIFTSFLEDIQAIDVYPLKKNNKPLIAGMNGNKGSVYGYPVNDGYNSIQGMIITFTDSVRKLLGKDTKYFSWFSDMIVDTFVDVDTLDKLAAKWRVDLGLETSDEVNKEEMQQEVYKNISAVYAANNQYAYSLATKARIPVTDKSSKALELYNYYRITGQTPLTLANNEKIKTLYPLNNYEIVVATQNGKFSTAHAEKPSYIITIPFESGNVDVPIKINDSIIDMPLLQEEANYIIAKLVSDERVANSKSKIQLKSGTRVNDTNGWKSTGYRFLLEVSGPIKNVEETLKDLKEELETIDKTMAVFDYNIDAKKKKIEIKINPVVQ